MRKNAGPKGQACRRSSTLRRSGEHETACGHNSGDTHLIESRRCKGTALISQAKGQGRKQALIRLLENVVVFVIIT